MKMTIHKIFLISIAFLGLAACNDDFLIEEPQSFLSPDVTYKTDAGLAAGATGLYDEISYPYFHSQTMRDFLAFHHAGSDFVQGGRQADRENINQLTESYGPATSDANLVRLWAHYYRLVNNATSVLEGSAVHDWTSRSLQAQTEGEAHFIRAWGHLWLTMLWGDIPPIRESVASVKADFVQEPKEQVLEYVIEDFTKAVSLLPEEAAQPGRLDKATANHMLAYAYLCVVDYAQAETAARAAIDAPNHSLVTERFGTKADDARGNPFWDLFQLDNHNNNPEGLWVLQNGNGDLTPQLRPTFGSGPAVRYVRNFHSRIELISGLKAGPEYGGRGFTRYSATLPFFDLYEPEDQRGQWPNMLKRFTAIEAGNIGGTPVAIGDLIFDFDNPEAGLITDITDLRLRPWPAKWLKESDPADTSQYHPNEVAYTGGTIRDHYIIRLAETYLILAEAQHMQGKDEEAAANINAIRERAGASPITAAEVSIDLILDEKARELWGEQYSRKVDLFRTGRFIERVQMYNAEAAPNVKPKHTLLPIPQSEIDLNRDAELVQNPGW